MSSASSTDILMSHRFGGNGDILYMKPKIGGGVTQRRQGNRDAKTKSEMDVIFPLRRSVTDAEFDSNGDEKRRRLLAGKIRYIYLVNLLSRLTERIEGL